MLSSTTSSNKLTLKLQTQTKTKRIRDLPPNFQALKAAVEAQIKDERDLILQESAALNLSKPGQRDYVIRYVDGDDEAINVSDDEDLLTAYEVADRELKGNLRFIIHFKN